MQQDPTDDKMYRHIKAFKAGHGRQLMERFGAHALGIGRKREEAGNKTQRWALLFYISPAAAKSRDIPPYLDYVPKGQKNTIRIPTQVVESSEASFE